MFPLQILSVGKQKHKLKVKMSSLLVYKSVFCRNTVVIKLMAKIVCLLIYKLLLGRKHSIFVK